MMSPSDLPACPADGSREVHVVRHPDGRIFYACRRCGRDQTEAWRLIQPTPGHAPIIGGSP